MNLGTDESVEGGELRVDHALPVGQALANDALNRGHFASSIARALKRVDSNSGLVLSVEGTWGSGKTSVLSMVQEILADEASDSPVIVHFNPWLIGERDALLRHFLSSISKAVKIADHAKSAKKVAKEIKTYSKAFDVLKFIPGAEPWASMIKGIIDSVGDVTESVGEYKTPDIVERKEAVERALRSYSKRIIVFIDDMDRLFPAEVFEMVRIIKAVGDLPNVGYVLAWDAAYVSEALKNLNVPFADNYLDKVVQVRLSVPPLSFSLRASLMDGLLRSLHPDALTEHFSNSGNSVPSLFHHGLSELLESPRDMVRLQDVVNTIEPGLRGEILLADIIGLACLMIKAPPVFHLLNRIPHAFVGRHPGKRMEMEKRQDVVRQFETERASAFQQCSFPFAVKALVEYIFPLVASSDGKTWRERGSFTEGHLAHPERLLVALQLALHPDNVSLAQVSQFIFSPDKRKEIVYSLSEASCLDFLGCLRDRAKSFRNDSQLDISQLCIEVAKLGDSEAFSLRTRNRSSVFEISGIYIIVETIEELASQLNDVEARQLAEKLIFEPDALSISARIVALSFGDAVDSERYRVRAQNEGRNTLVNSFADNIEKSILEDTFFLKSSPGLILGTIASFESSRCLKIFELILSIDPSCDRFVESYLRTSLDSVNGQQYGLPKDMTRLESFVPLDKLKEMANNRLLDENLAYPTKAAWRSVVEECQIYGNDGTVAEDRH